jgi:hypothetical protein
MDWMVETLPAGAMAAAASQLSVPHPGYSPRQSMHVDPVALSDEHQSLPFSVTQKAGRRMSFKGKRSGAAGGANNQGSPFTLTAAAKRRISKNRLGP